MPLARVPQLDGSLDGVVGAVVPSARAEDGWDGVVGAQVGRLRARRSPLEAYMASLPIPAEVQAQMDAPGPSRRLPQVDGSSELDPASPPLQTLDDGRGTEEIGSDLDDSDDSDADDVESELRCGAAWNTVHPKISSRRWGRWRGWGLRVLHI